MRAGFQIHRSRKKPTITPSLLLQPDILGFPAVKIAGYVDLLGLGRIDLKSVLGHLLLLAQERNPDSFSVPHPSSQVQLDGRKATPDFNVSS